MKLLELFEARKNPGQNPKQSINQLIQRDLEHTTSTIAGVKNCFVSFTWVDKLGINPRNKHDTPYGIYAYPAEYAISQVGDFSSMNDLPFAGNAPYANTFSATGNIINLATMSQGDAGKLYKAIVNYWHTLSKKPQFDAETDVWKHIKNAEREALVADRPGGKLWYVVMMVSQELVAPHLGIDARVAWNKLFRAIGVDGVIDYDPGAGEGRGIVHTNEPSQAVFFSAAAISDVKRHLNKYSPSALAANASTGEIAGRIQSLLAGATTADEVLAVLERTELWGIRLVKNPTLRLETILKRHDLIRHLKNPTLAEQVALIKQDPFAAAAFIRPISQHAVLKAAAEEPELKMPFREMFKFGTEILPELQLVIAAKGPLSFVSVVKRPTREALALAVETQTAEANGKRNIQAALAHLAIKHGVPYKWIRGENYMKYLNMIANAERELAAETAKLENISDSQDPEDEHEAEAIRASIGHIEYRLKEYRDHIKEVDYIYKNSIDGKGMTS